MYPTDNLPYEKVGKNEPVCIADEVPFDIPESWEWARISTVFSLQAGKNIQAADISESDFDGAYLCYGGNGVRGYVKSYNREGNYPIIGRQGALCGNIKNAKGKFYATEHAVCVETFSQTNVEWACAFLEALNLNQYATATAQPGLAVANINTILIPIPPQNEQQRIVDVLSSLEPFIEFYAKKEYELNTLNQQFSNLLKKSILQEAVQGKLVSQDSNDEPASVLLERIRVEKQCLVQDGKIKKDKHESVIFRRDNSHYEKRGSEEVCIDDEIPFEIPENWCWARMGSCLDVRDGTHDTPKHVLEGIPLVTSKNLCNGKIDFSTAKFISREDHLAISRRSKVDAGDIMYAMIGSIGNPVLYNGNAEFSIKNMALFKKIANGLDMEYVYWFLYLSQDTMKKFASGGVQSFVSLGYLRNYWIPVPPIQEQHRIVTAIKQILPKISTL